jgi:hypothetical protein
MKKNPIDLYAGRAQKEKQGSIFPSAAGNLYLKGNNTITLNFKQILFDES